MEILLGTEQRCNLTMYFKMKPLSGIVLMHLRCNYVVCLTIIMSQFITKGNFWKRIESAVRKQISISPQVICHFIGKRYWNKSFWISLLGRWFGQQNEVTHLNLFKNCLNSWTVYLSYCRVSMWYKACLLWMCHLDPKYLNTFMIQFSTLWCRETSHNVKQLWFTKHAEFQRQQHDP